MLLVLRLVLVPILIAIVTLVTRRWGQRVGGFVTALPAVAGPTLVFYAVQQGRLFAADAARGSLFGLVGVAAFCLAYARASVRLHWAPCLLIGWTSFAVVTSAIHRVEIGPLAALIVAVTALLAVRAMLPSSRSERVPPKPRRSTECVGGAKADRWDLPLRMLSAGTLVFALTSAADRLGSSVSGILTPFPVATAILAGFTHAQSGSAASVEFLRAFIPGLCSFGVFCFVLAIALPRMSTVGSFAAALSIQIVVQVVLFNAEAFRLRR